MTAVHPTGLAICVARRRRDWTRQATAMHLARRADSDAETHASDVIGIHFFQPGHSHLRREGAVCCNSGSLGGCLASACIDAGCGHCYLVQRASGWTDAACNQVQNRGRTCCQVRPCEGPLMCDSERLCCCDMMGVGTGWAAMVTPYTLMPRALRAVDTLQRLCILILIITALGVGMAWNIVLEQLGTALAAKRNAGQLRQADLQPWGPGSGPTLPSPVQSDDDDGSGESGLNQQSGLLAARLAGSIADSLLVLLAVTLALHCAKTAFPHALWHLALHPRQRLAVLGTWAPVAPDSGMDAFRRPWAHPARLCLGRVAAFLLCVASVAGAVLVLAPPAASWRSLGDLADFMLYFDSTWVRPAPTFGLVLLLVAAWTLYFALITTFMCVFGVVVWQAGVALVHTLAPSPATPFLQRAFGQPTDWGAQSAMQSWIVFRPAAWRTVDATAPLLAEAGRGLPPPSPGRRRLTPGAGAEGSVTTPLVAPRATSTAAATAPGASPRGVRVLPVEAQEVGAAPRLPGSAARHYDAAWFSLGAGEVPTAHPVRASDMSLVIPPTQPT